MSDKSFSERADKALLVFGVMLPNEIRQLLRDMATAIDQLKGATHVHQD